MPNRLATETSPYLLQHQNNPVDWQPWDDQALEQASALDRPIFLSIGYSACHWCHVMEHESFENPQIAELMNQHFINIKVDREERPDLDQIYMQAVQTMTGRGGWPMSVFLTPDLQPFFGGTYWPPNSQRGMAGFDQVLLAVHDAWKNRRPQALAQAAQLTEQIQIQSTPEMGDGQFDESLLLDAGMSLERVFDFRNGGFGGAPKFPHPMDIRLLLRLWRRTGRDGLRQMAITTLDKMAAGGIYDHLGGGFHRYSVDDRWLVPHFEKMLYDNALLAAAYTDGYLATGNREYHRVACETLDYVLREMTDPQGGFYSTEDADSEGHEGKFYVWSRAELDQRLGVEAAETFAAVYDVSQQGNFEGSNILNLPKSIENYASLRKIDAQQLREQLARDRQKLLAARATRVRPSLDDKLIVSWNGLMIDALAHAAGALEQPRYLQTAKKAADFLMSNLHRPDGRLLHTWRHGKAKFAGFLDDYASLANALVSLYEASFDVRYLNRAVTTAENAIKYFTNFDGGGFYFTAEDQQRLVARMMDVHDSSVPSGNAMMATALLRLAKITGRDDFRQSAEGTLRSGQALMEKSPMAAGQMLLALDFHLGPTPEIVILGDSTSAETTSAIAALHRQFIPNKIVIQHDTSQAGEIPEILAPLLRGKHASAGAQPTVFVCEHATCQPPVVGVESVQDLWKLLATPTGQKH